MGLLVLANMIRHAIPGDPDRPTFRMLIYVYLTFKRSLSVNVDEYLYE
jgi:hypothetical protein